jgi:hypothetical protein
MFGDTRKCIFMRDVNTFTQMVQDVYEKAAMDHEFRRRIKEDSDKELTDMGYELDPGQQFCFIERGQPRLEYDEKGVFCIYLPARDDLDTELSDEMLEKVAGGGGPALPDAGNYEAIAEYARGVWGAKL